MSSDPTHVGPDGNGAKNRYWVSFDLGLTGNYDLLYRWLDAFGAEECAFGLATFTSAYSREQLESEIRTVLAVDSLRIRVYLISRSSDGSVVGKFVVGSRKAAPWTGYAERSASVEDVA